MVTSTRTKGSCPCTDYKRRKSLCRYFSLQHRCTVYAVLYGKTSHVVLSRTKHPKWILPGPFWTPSPGSVPSCFRLSSLIFPRGKTTKRPVVFIDVRGVKNEHVTQPRNVSLFLMLFVTVLTVLISIKFYFLFGFVVCWYRRHVTIRKGVYSCHILQSTEDATVWASKRHGLVDLPLLSGQTGRLFLMQDYTGWTCV